MELISATRPVVACIYGASLTKQGTRLRCGLLFVQAGNKRATLTFRNPETKERVRVRLPDSAVGAAGRTRFSRLELEIV